MTDDYNYYLNGQVPEEERRYVAFQTVNAICESVTLATRKKRKTLIKALDS